MVDASTLSTTTSKIRIASSSTATTTTKESPVPAPMTIVSDTDHGHHYHQHTRTSSTSVSTTTSHDTLQYNYQPPSLQQQLEEEEFWQWCHDVLLISTFKVRIQHFPYPISSIITTTTSTTKRRHAVNNNNRNIDDDGDDDFLEYTSDDEQNDDITATTETSNAKANQNDNDSNNDPHRDDIIWIRGLAASQDIVPNDVLVRIPVPGLFSVTTTIDHDPVLSQIMGPAARAKYGWNDEIEEEDSRSTLDRRENTTNEHYYNSSSYQMYEIPLLTIALLYHRSMGTESSMYPYMKILQRSPVDHLPYTWKNSQWNQYTTTRRSWSFDTVWNVAHDIRHEMMYMYRHVVVKTLMTEYPHLFGRNVVRDPITNEWMYSFPMFQWAYAIVNSRHWQLPKDTMASRHPDVPKRFVPDPVPPTPPLSPERLVDQVPPADTPTESWVLEHGDVDDDDDKGHEQSSSSDGGRHRRSSANTVTMSSTVDHSFLAPVADLLNFGPPCTRVKYNAETHTFDTIATCHLVAGQEITFWYSNECRDVMMGMYGLTHPLISPCPTNDELQYRNKLLEQKLHDAYNDMKMLEDDLEYVEKVLDDCDCCNAVPLTTTSGEERRDPMISTMALHEEKTNGNPHLRHLEDSTSTTTSTITTSVVDRAALSPTTTTTRTTGEEQRGVHQQQQQQQHEDEPSKNHLLVRRTRRRWSSATSEF